MPKYKFSKQTLAVEEEVIAHHDALKEWRPDKKGYFLIRLKDGWIEAGFVTYKHVITKVVKGKYAIEVYNTIIREGLVSKLEHAAYLGKELYKAELALKYGKTYVQEGVLSLGRAKVQLEQES